MTSGIEHDVLEYARQQAERVFEIWDEGGDFMAADSQARVEVETYAKLRTDGLGSDAFAAMNGRGFLTYIEHYCALKARWDVQLEMEASALGRSAGARRRRLHHVRSVFR